MGRRRRAFKVANAFLAKNGGLMIIFPTAAAFVGILLGFRFKIAVLVPTMLLLIAVIIVHGISVGHGLSVIVLTAFGTIASLQIGYLLGGILQQATSHLLTRTTAPLATPHERTSDRVRRTGLLHH
jgi:hypothetical protein